MGAPCPAPHNVLRLPTTCSHREQFAANGQCLPYWFQLPVSVPPSGAGHVWCSSSSGPRRNAIVSYVSVTPSRTGSRPCAGRAPPIHDDRLYVAGNLSAVSSWTPTDG